MHQAALANRLVTLASRARLVRDVTHNLGESVLIPLGRFYGVVVAVGLKAALLAALVWSFFATIVRPRSRRDGGSEPSWG